METSMDPRKLPPGTSSDVSTAIQAGCFHSLYGSFHRCHANVHRFHGTGGSFHGNIRLLPRKKNESALDPGSIKEPSGYFQECWRQIMLPYKWMGANGGTCQWYVVFIKVAPTPIYGS